MPGKLIQWAWANNDDPAVRFKLLGSEIGRPLLRSAGRQAGILIRDEMARNAPRLTGRLQDEMTVATRKESDVEIHVIVGPSKRAFYGRFVDAGTKFLHGLFFMRRAIDSKGAEAAARFSNLLIEKMEKAFRKSLPKL
jgi:HK97 gp10 family phage protein